MFSVKEIMTTELYTLAPDDSLQDARKVMAEHNVRHIPIVTEGRQLKGLLSQRDVLAAADSKVQPHSENAAAMESQIAISSAMTVNPTTIDEDTSLRGAGLHMQQHQIGCLPVVRDDAVVGIITDSDFVAVAINLMEQLEDAEPEE